MKNVDIYEVVTALIGPINPIGETNTDDARYENLENMTNLIDTLLVDLIRLSKSKNRCEYSIKRAGLKAFKFLRDFEIIFSEEL